MAKIVVDTPTEEGLWFKDYADALVNIIVDSGSPFTIGILGKWGVGKTSLMEMMFEKLKAKEAVQQFKIGRKRKVDNALNQKRRNIFGAKTNCETASKHEKNVIPIWFNAWRCEREKEFAFIPLLKLLLSKIKDNRLKRELKEFIKSLEIKIFVPGIAEISRGSRRNKVKEDSSYAELNAIEKTLKKMDTKIVVFIDDLDRCAPDKILEVLESIKVFLDTGFVYVLGLDSELVVKAIEEKYLAMMINGEDYLEKIVQIPFRIPDWNETDRGDVLTDLVDKDKIDSEYKDTIGEYKDIIQEAIERTPRQVKRFINTYICEQEIFKGKKLDQTIHLVLTILKFKWYNFYQKLFDDNYRQNLNVLLGDENKLREELKNKDGLFDFIISSKARKTIEKIIKMNDTQLSEYRRAGMITPQKISELVTSLEKLIELLRSEKVSKFNALRANESIEEIDLSVVDLNGANLSGANLSGTNLHGANLNGANLSGANLHGANLSGAFLSDADLREADLGDSDLYESRLLGSSLDNAILVRAILTGPFLDGCSMGGADLRETIILVKPKQYDLGIKDADFNNALINDSGFLKYLKENGAKNVPDEIANKDEIMNLLKARGISLEGIEQFFGE